MDIRNCRSCGKLFNYMGGAPICPLCLKALDEKFDIVKAYIYDHPGASMQEVAEENDVTIPQIQKWVREERLSFAENSLVGIECENCGVSIRTGRFCKSCKDKLANNLGNMYREPEEPVKSTNKRKDFLDNPKVRKDF